MANKGEKMKPPHRIVTLLFPKFELLDVFGPLEMFGMSNRVLLLWLEDAKLKSKLKPSFNGYNLESVVRFSLESSKPIASPENVVCLTNATVSELKLKEEGGTSFFASTSLLLPGGLGVRQTVLDEKAMKELKRVCDNCDRVFSVCTGSALLAQANVLEFKNATTNKMSYDYATQFGKNVKWKKNARWVKDGAFWTSSGVSAGMDMALKIIEEDSGSAEFARAVAHRAEYIWNEDSENDPFAKL